MQHYQLKKVTDKEGKITISDLPASRELTILVLPSGTEEWQEKMKQWMNDLREYHPFTDMNKEEILKHLRKTRQEVWKEECDH